MLISFQKSYYLVLIMSDNFIDFLAITALDKFCTCFIDKSFMTLPALQYFLMWLNQGGKGQLIYSML